MIDCRACSQIRLMFRFLFLASSRISVLMVIPTVFRCCFLFTFTRVILIEDFIHDSFLLFSTLSFSPQVTPDNKLDGKSHQSLLASCLRHSNVHAATIDRRRGISQKPQIHHPFLSAPHSSHIARYRLTFIHGKPPVFDR